MSETYQPEPKNPFLLAFIFIFSVTCFWLLMCPLAQSGEIDARIAVIDAQLTARKWARPELPNDFVGPSDVGTPPWRIEASNSLLTTLAETLGEAGQILLRPEQAIVIKRPEATITLKPGTEIKYRFSDNSGHLEFAGQKPRIEARVLGLRIAPELTQLELSSDNSGVATVDAGGFKVTKRFRLDWEETTPSVSNTTPRNPDACSCGCGKASCTCSRNSQANQPMSQPVLKNVVFVTSKTDWCPGCRIERPKVESDAANPNCKYRWRLIETDATTIVDVDGTSYRVEKLPSYLWKDAKGVVNVVHDYNSFRAAVNQ